jgi:unsaturated rhamnogalacturonyl hydrolase
MDEGPKRFDRIPGGSSDVPAKKGNYLEASASCMFVYALAKGVRMGYLPESDEAVARRGCEGIQ